MSEQPQPQKEAAFFTTIRQWGLVRGPNGVVGGVVEGLGARVGLAAVPARLIVVLGWLLLPGLVMLGYAAAWALLPDRHGNIIIQNFGRGVTNVGALLGIAVLTLLGFGSFDSTPVFGWFGSGPASWFVGGGGGSALAIFAAVLIPVLLLGGVVALIVWLVKRSSASAPPPPGYPYNPADAGAPQAPNPTTAAHSASQQAPAHASAPLHGGPRAPQAWEPALLPGDPRLAGVAGGTQPPAANYSTTTPAPGPQPHGPQSAGPQPGPAYAPAPPPHTPARPTVPGPGRGGYFGFLGILFIAAAIVFVVERFDRLAVHPVLAWGAVVTVGLGLVLIVVALSGRKLGALGVLSVIAVLVGVPFAANAEEIRADYQNEWSWFAGDHVADDFVEEEWVEEEELPEYSPADLSEELAPLYSTLFVTGSCVEPSTAEPWQDVVDWGGSVATMRLGAVDANLTLDLTAESTRVAVPRGTSIEIRGSGTTTVVWEDRDMSCESWIEHEYSDSGDQERQPVLAVTNPDTPVLTLNTSPDTTIYIKEVAR